MKLNIKFIFIYLTIIVLTIIIFTVFYLFAFKNQYKEQHSNNTKLKFIINSYKDNNIALTHLLSGLQNCPEFSNYEIIIFIGGYCENSKYIIDKQEGNITYILCNHNSIDFNGLIGIFEFLKDDDDDCYYFYMHDTCYVGNNFLKNIENIDLTNVTSLKLRNNERSMNIGIYSKKIINNLSNLLIEMKNTDPDKSNEYKKLGVTKEDLIFNNDTNNKSINNIDNFLTVSEPHDYYNTGTLRVVEYYNIDLYKIKANWGNTDNYTLKI